MVTTLDCGLLLLRLVLAALLIGHGLQKAFGWFHGPGHDGATALFHQWGFRPARTMVCIAAVCELTAGGLTLLGLLNPLAAAITVGTMTVAAAPNAARGLWAARGGYELPLVYALLAGGLALTGPGRVSLDHLAGTPTAPWLGPSGIAVGLLASTVPLAQRRATLRHTAPTQ